MRRIRLLLLCLSFASAAASQDLPPSYAGPPPPQLPATVAVDDAGHVTVRAVRLDAPLKIDGALDEEFYRTVTPISDFIQTEPRHNAPGTEKTEAWIAFDDDNVYVSVRASESQPERMVVNEMRRDSVQLLFNENFSFAFDTFYDRRNSLNFYFTPSGGRGDGQNTNEGQYNPDWNPIWKVSVRRVQGGWTAEAAVPFKSLRYGPGRTQTWGVQLRRVNRWKNEISFLTQVPEGQGMFSIMRASSNATLVGIEAPPGSRAFEVKPFATSNLTSDATVTPRTRNQAGWDAGADVKYGITQNLTADVTVNTDFAQVEADEQQVNLTRFSLFFPEKRDFFLENQGLFNFGGVTAANAGDVPVLFYSRRIGLDQGHEIPLRGGGRLTGRFGKVNIGVLNIETGANDAFHVPATNFSVARVARNIFRRSAVGAIATHRSQTGTGTGAADTFGVDGNFAFFQNLNFATFVAQTRTPGVREDTASYRGQVNYNADRYQVQLDRLHVGDHFNPDVGFARRDNMDKSFLQVRFSPRPKRRFRRVRRFGYETHVTYIQNTAGRLESRDAVLDASAEFQNSDRLDIQYHRGYEVLSAPFAIARGVTIPVGGYTVGTVHAEYRLGSQHLAAGTVYVEHGPFYNGDRSSLAYTAGRVRFTPHFAVEPGVQINKVSLPYGHFTAALLTSRATYTVTPLMFVSGLIQYSSSGHSLSTNLRLRWEYQPGSELFVVYNDARDTRLPGLSGLQNRAVVVKINRLFRF